MLSDEIIQLMNKMDHNICRDENYTRIVVDAAESNDLRELQYLSVRQMCKNCHILRGEYISIGRCGDCRKLYLTWEDYSGRGRWPLLYSEEDRAKLDKFEKLYLDVDCHQTDVLLTDLMLDALNDDYARVLQLQITRPAKSMLTIYDEMSPEQQSKLFSEYLADPKNGWIAGLPGDKL